MFWVNIHVNDMVNVKVKAKVNVNVNAWAKSGAGENNMCKVKGDMWQVASEK